MKKTTQRTETTKRSQDKIQTGLSEVLNSITDKIQSMEDSKDRFDLEEKSFLRVLYANLDLYHKRLLQVNDRLRKLRDDLKEGRL